MRKLSMFVLIVMLIASLFISCDNSVKSMEDGLVEVRIGTDSNSRGLGAAIDMSEEGIVWHYSATKVTERQFKFGETSDSVLPATRVVTFSQGIWDFGLWAVKDGKNVYSGTSTNVLITRDPDGDAVPVVVPVSPYTGDKGYIELTGVKIHAYTKAETPVEVTPNYLSIDENPIADFRGDFTKAEFETGPHTVVVAYKGTDNVTYASETIYVTVYSGRTTTITGFVDEITGSANISHKSTVAMVAITDGVAPERPSEVTVSVTPAMKGNTIVSFPAGSFNAASNNAVLTLNAKPIGSNFTVGATDSSDTAVAGLDVSLLVDNKPVTSFNNNAVTITTYIAKGLSDVKVYYNGSVIASDESTNIYDEVTGELTFTTTHFSEYYVGAAEVAAYVKETSTAYTTLNSAIESSTNNTVVLLKDITENVVVPEGKTVTLDLNGHTITNNGSHTILNKGNLTVIGNGTVDNITHAKAALYNEVGATATLNGGEYTRSSENGQSGTNNGGNSYYAILNHGEMVINEGVSVVQNGQYSSLLENGWQNGSDVTGAGTNVVLTINGGTFSGGLNTIKNDDWGVLTINGGVFANVAQQAVLNWNVTTINGGTFQSNYTAVYAGSYVNDMDQGKLTVTGGIFNYDDRYYGITGESAANITITGGQFATKNISNRLSDEYKVVQDGDGYTVEKKRVFEVSNFSEFKSAIAQSNDDLIVLTATINPTNNFEFDRSVTVDMNGYGFVRATEASGGYGIKLIPGCNLTMKNGSWDMAASFGNISAEGSNGTCIVKFENVIFTNLENHTKRPGIASNLVKTAFKANMQGNLTVKASFINCTFNNANVEFSGFNSGNTYTAVFKGCTFNNIGNASAIKADNYGMSENCKVSVDNCHFDITVTSNVSVFETRYNGNTVKLNLTDNTINGTVADPNTYELFATTSLKTYNSSYKFDVTESGTTLSGIATLN